jgi:hypothetical protein
MNVVPAKAGTQVRSAANTHAKIGGNNASGIVRAFTGMTVFRLTQRIALAKS